MQRGFVHIHSNSSFGVRTIQTRRSSSCVVAPTPACFSEDVRGFCLRIYQTSLCLLSASLFIGVLLPCANAGQTKTDLKKNLKTRQKNIPSQKSITVKKILSRPFLDGIAVDECWRKVPCSKIRIVDGKNILFLSLKACTDGRKIYFLIQYPTPGEIRKHQSWHWNPVLQAYIPGKEKEESFTIILTQQKDNIKKADVWVWRAARTDPVNKADDLFFQITDKANQAKKSIVMDAGTNCWFSKYFGDFAGSELPRFYNRTPQGSLADIDAKGTWDRNFLTIEFSRVLNTGNEDDIKLMTGKYYIQLHRGTPNVKTLEKKPYIPLLLK